MLDVNKFTEHAKIPTEAQRLFSIILKRQKRELQTGDLSEDRSFARDLD